MRFLSYIVLILFVGCVEPIDWELTGDDTGILVVEGTFTNERKNHVIRLSFSHPQSNQARIPATGATVILSDGTENVTLVEFPANTGNYYTPEIQAVIDKPYILFISINGEDYFAADQAVPVEPLEFPRIEPVSDTTRIIRPGGGGAASYTTHIMSWEHTDECPKYDACYAKLNHYDLNSIDVNSLFPPPKNPVFFPPGTLMVRKKYSLSIAHQAFLRTMLSETEWRGGIFDVEKGNVTGNVSNGALGYFGVSMVDIDTVLVW